MTNRNDKCDADLDAERNNIDIEDLIMATHSAQRTLKAVDKLLSEVRKIATENYQLKLKVKIAELEGEKHE